DIGGTFVDFCAFNAGTGELQTLKVLTTPEDPGAEIATGLSLLEIRHGIKPSAISGFVHGTTVGINTVIQRRGARLGLITTAGFEDVLELARLQMPDMYSLFCSRPEQLIPRDCIFGVRERTLSDGSVQVPLDEAGLRSAVAKAKSKGCEGVVIAFLNSYRNQANEIAARELVSKAAPDLFVFSSAAVWPVVREYERMTTAILNAYVHPRVSGYLGALERRLRERDVPARPMVTKSNGGIMNAALGKTDCVGMMLSGTASGVMGAAYVAGEAGAGNVLTLDIGGTSADVALIIDRSPQFGSGEQIGDFPLNIPSVSVTSIGDGGGSIATADSYGVLKVGPESAGSTPGPAAYGRGGTRATLTDALVVTGFLGHAPLAYRSIELDRAAAERAMLPLAEATKLSLHETADAIVKIAVSNMYVEVNKLVARYGVDLRDFSLFPFGGAGPMLGCFLAKEMGVGQVIIPRRPGVVSALGGLIADVKCDFIETVFQPVTGAGLEVMRKAALKLRADAVRWLRREQGYEGEALVSLSADMRYAGQSFEIDVALEEDWLERMKLPAIVEAFNTRHKEIYDFADPRSEVFVVNLRLVIAGPTPKPRFAELPRGKGSAKPLKETEVWLEGARRRIALFDRAALRHGQTFAGPCVISQEDATTIVPRGYSGSVDRLGNLVLTLGQ
ncbi:MAG: hydantoinase/oxoprolinase family protein, partial [Hyphomicrobiaceae bacterium]